MDAPMVGAVSFQSPPSLAVEVVLPNAGTVRGMGIRCITPFHIVICQDHDDTDALRSVCFWVLFMVSVTGLPTDIPQRNLNALPPRFVEPVSLFGYAAI